MTPLAVDPIAAKLACLRAMVREMGSVLVAYSGGVDSALMMLVAHQELGPKAHVRLKRMETYAGAWVKDAPNSSLPRKP